MQLNRLTTPTRAAVALFALKLPFAATLRRSVTPAKALLAATVAMVLAIAASIASAQTVTVGTRILAMITFPPGDIGASGMRESTATTPPQTTKDSNVNED